MGDFGAEGRRVGEQIQNLRITQSMSSSTQESQRVFNLKKKWCIVHCWKKKAKEKANITANFIFCHSEHFEENNCLEDRKICQSRKELSPTRRKGSIVQDSTYGCLVIREDYILQFLLLIHLKLGRKESSNTDISQNLSYPYWGLISWN